MKLLTKLSIRYIIYSMVAMVVSGILIYILISMFVDRQLDEKLSGMAIQVEQKLSEDGQVNWLKPFVDGSEIHTASESKVFADTLIYNLKEDEFEEYRQLKIVRKINQRF